MTPDELRHQAKALRVYQYIEGFADAWEAERIARHMEAAKFLSQIAAWKASCEDAEKRLEAGENAMPYAKVIAHIVRPGTHRLAVVIDEETTDDEKDALLAFCAALAGEEK